MSETQPILKPQWAARIAIDWGGENHHWALQLVPGASIEKGSFESSPEAVAEWVNSLNQRFGGRSVAVALEQQRGALVYQLIQYPFLVLYPIPPAMSASYRQTFTSSGAKDDPSDAALLLDLLTRHSERLRPWKPDTPETRLLQLLAEQRRQMVQERTRHLLQLQDCLRQYFPQLLKWFDRMDRVVVGDLLERWPELSRLQRTKPGPLRRFFEKHCRGEERIQERIDAIYSAVPRTTDAAVVEACSRKARSLVKLLAVWREEIAELEGRIEELVAAHPDAQLFASLPGAGDATVPRLIAAFGTDRDRYQSAHQMQCYSGIAPVKEASGKSQWTHFRRACPKFLRQTFHEYAGQSIPRSVWAKEFYMHQRERKQSHHAAVRALAYKWIRIIYRCWKDRKPYDERVYLESLRRRSSQTGKVLASVTAAASWKGVAGFHKLSPGPA